MRSASIVSLLLASSSFVIALTPDSRLLSAKSFHNILGGASDNLPLLDQFKLSKIPANGSAPALFVVVQPSIAKEVPGRDNSSDMAVYRVKVSGFVGTYKTSSRIGSLAGSFIGRFLPADARNSPYLKPRIALLTLASATNSHIRLALTPMLPDGTADSNRISKTITFQTDVDDGYFSSMFDLGVSPNVSTLIVSAEGDTNHYQQKILLASISGYSIVSDIDDTIKVTGTLNNKQVFNTTFASKFEAIPGMPEVYQEWNQGLASNSLPTFHYVSGGFIKLSPIYQKFVEEEAKFPAGEIRMDRLTLMDLKSVMDTSRVHDFKLDTIQHILETQPDRKFILVGDSTQSDPEVYGELLATYPKQVSCVLIHVVKGYNLQKEAMLNLPERFKRAFTAVPGGAKSPKVLIYNDVKDLPASKHILSGKCQRS